ncbi:hypothetical protein [Mariniblastus fucicola]|uniref:Uncharacterized protein n=1 Tax=Mariniblastus fucicola TaxID=980251 RepID=A0A5B9P972_9BACT|nr:hypothetical protein [Mariniblastus fucicola]QEG21430.1 hypothetical protein MFFC18_12860 [Mariniblastus fucicola]
MSQTKSYPPSGPQGSEVATGIKVSSAELELGCINLISQLEMQIESARSGSGHVEKASVNTDKLLSVLLDFCDQYFDGDTAGVALESIEKASFASLAHREVLSSLGWGFAVRNLFGKSVCSDDRVRQTYDSLGNALLTACVSVLRQAVLAVGCDSAVGKTIEQSTAVFVEEFKANW